MKTAHGNKLPSSTKAGPGRYHKQGGGRQDKPTRAYVALMAAWAERRVIKPTMRDEHGAYTMVGKPYELIGVKPRACEVVIEAGIDHGERFYTVRRMWLAGISAQRGY